MQFLGHTLTSAYQENLNIHVSIFLYNAGAVVRFKSGDALTEFIMKDKAWLK